MKRKDPNRRGTVRRAVKYAILWLVFVLALLAGAAGYMQLARLIGDGALQSTYTAMAILIDVWVLLVLFAYALWARPLGALESVRRNRTVLERRAGRLLRGIGAKVTILVGAFGVGVGVGLQTLVGNFAAGLILLFERPIREGDAIQVGDVQGAVRHIGVRASTVRTGKGADVFVPNAQLLWTNRFDRSDAIRSELAEAVCAALTEAKIPLPQREVWLRMTGDSAEGALRLPPSA